MAQPIYFLPKVSLGHSATPAHKRQALKDAGLADVFRDVKAEHIATILIETLGPGETSGTIVTYTDDRECPPRFGYFPEQQTWYPIDEKLWIGLHKDHPPTPADMRRARTYRGYEIELADLNEWEVPVIRRPGDLATTLPQSQHIKGGKLVKKLKPDFQAYWDHSEETADFFLAGKETLTIRLHELAVEALSLNYRFGHNEQEVMGLVDSENYQAILSYTIDLPHVREMLDSQKKTESPPEQQNS